MSMIRPDGRPWLPPTYEVDRTFSDLEPLKEVIRETDTNTYETDTERIDASARLCARKLLNLTQEDVLKPAGLDHLRPFIRIYSNMTNNVLHCEGSTPEEVAQEYGYPELWWDVDGRPTFFEDPDLLKANMEPFLDSVVDDIDAYARLMEGDDDALKDIDPAWAMMMFDPRVKRASRYQQLGIGVSNHIIVDLGPSMSKVGITRKYWRDYQRVDNPPIKHTIRQEFERYRPQGLWLPKATPDRISGEIKKWRVTSFEDCFNLDHLTNNGGDVEGYKLRLNRNAMVVNEKILRYGNIASAAGSLITMSSMRGSRPYRPAPEDMIY